MIRDPRRWRKLRIFSLASLATLLLVSVALLGFGVRQLVHVGRPATYRLNMLVDTEPNRQVLARGIAAEARKRGLVLELSPRAHPALEVRLGLHGPGDPELYPRAHTALASLELGDAHQPVYHALVPV